MSDRHPTGPERDEAGSSRPESGAALRSDVLLRAAAALRAAHDGHREGSGFTRARILATVAERRRPRLRRWLVLAPFGSALLVGSAWAQSTGSWPRVWSAMASALPFIAARREEPVERRPRAPAAAPQPRPAAPPAEPPAAAEPPPEEPGAPPEPPAPSPEVSPAPAASPAVTPAVSPALRRSRGSPVEPPAADPELRDFRDAHELHVQDRPREALAAYERYLRAHPNGRFVPEARYNSALDAIKLGEHERARRALQPFAEGAHDGYRQAEARRLLEALDGAERR